MEFITKLQFWYQQPNKEIYWPFMVAYPSGLSIIFSLEIIDNNWDYSTDYNLLFHIFFCLFEKQILFLWIERKLFIPKHFWNIILHIKHKKKHLILAVKHYICPFISRFSWNEIEVIQLIHTTRASRA